ncbi:MAG: class I adenylate-forming enzyme family protein [Haloarculaceae archaeon]
MRGLTSGYLSERNARQAPDREAVVMQGPDGRRETVTFAEFDDRVNRVANGLRDRGIDEGDKVAVFTQNSVETVESYFGAMKLGALPVPINHRFKADEVRYVLEDSGAEVLVFDADAADIVDAIHDSESTPDQYLYTDADDPAYADSYQAFRESSPADPVDIVPDRLDEAMLMYTSGTTGRPKGCILTHDNIVQNSQNTVYEADFGRGEDERFLVVTPLFHVAAFALFHNTFYIGGTTLLLDEFLPGRIMEILEEESVTGSFFVPTMSRALLDLPDFDSYDLSSFQHYMTGAAPSGEELKRDIIESFDVDLYDAFGQTEMSPVTTMLLPEDALEHPDSVGRPVINVELKILDPETGEEVAQGDPGRACYKSPTRFKGYYNMPEKTESVIDEDGWFHSGDLVRRDEDGFVYFVGRSDDMIISGGENIYPAEIEEVLHEHEAIDEAAVVGVPDETWGQRVKAAVVLHDGYDLTAEEVQDYVDSRLADYKKPREVLFLDELPRNPSGKILRNQLEALDD